MVALSGGSIVDDFDNDGYLDVVASSWGLDDQLRYFRNQGDGTFAERTEQAGLTGQVGGLNICQADYDNDGHRDILVLRGAWLAELGHHPNSLLRNIGGTFADVTEAVRVAHLSPYPLGGLERLRQRRRPRPLRRQRVRRLGAAPLPALPKPRRRHLRRCRTPR